MAITKESLLAECQQQAAQRDQILAQRDQLLAQSRELTAQAQTCEGARVMAAKLLAQLSEGEAPAPEASQNGKGRVSRKPAEAVA